MARFGARLRNVQWSVSSWTAEGASASGSTTGARAKTARLFAREGQPLAGPGNSELRENVNKAFKEKSAVRLIVVRTSEVARVEAGDDASKIKKEFHSREELVGKRKRA